MFDVFPLTQNKVSTVIFHATITLVMIAYYFIISEKQIFNRNLSQSCFFSGQTNRIKIKLARSFRRNKIT